ncbi:MAG: hypothetical protein GY771_15760 [bacterium]|nr:hypothetical protein [bacterium]
MRAFISIIISVSLLPHVVNAYDWEWNSGGTMDCVPTMGGTWDGWGEWFITTVYNDTSFDIIISKFGFPCSYGDGTGPYEDISWAVWLDVGGTGFLPDNPFTADESGTFDPVDDNDTDPPTIYSYVDLRYSQEFTIYRGTYFCFGYRNPGLGGQIDFNGVNTWSWHSDTWESDGNKGRTAILQLCGSYYESIDSASLGTIKATFK